MTARGDLDAVVQAVRSERARQDMKWGEQNHPDVAAHLVGRPLDVRTVHGIPTAGHAKQMTDSRAKWGRVSWADIAIEELAEAVEAAALGDEDAVRTEVIQLAAVCVQWIQAIDRRRTGRMDALRAEQAHAAMLGCAHLPGPHL